MTILRAWKAVMATVLMLFGPMAQMVEAQNLEVVREGMSRSLNVVMNQIDKRGHGKKQYTP